MGAIPCGCNSTSTKQLLQNGYETSYLKLCVDIQIFWNFSQIFVLNQKAVCSFWFLHRSKLFFVLLKIICFEATPLSSVCNIIYSYYVNKFYDTHGYDYNKTNKYTTYTILERQGNNNKAMFFTFFIAGKCTYASSRA